MESINKQPNYLPQGEIKIKTQILQYSMGVGIQLEDIEFYTNMFQYSEGPSGFSAIEMDSGLSVDIITNRYNQLEPLYRNIVSHRTPLLIESINASINHEKKEGKPYFSHEEGKWLLTMPFYLDDFNSIVDKSMELAIYTIELLSQIVNEDFTFMEMSCFKNKNALLNDIKFLSHCKSVLQWPIGKSLKMIKG